MPDSASSQDALQQATGPAHWLDDVAKRDSQRLLLETRKGTRLTYADMAALSGRIAAALHARGVAHGDRVVAQIDKSPEAVALYLACLRVGAAFVPLNTAYTLAELEYFLTDAQPTVAVVRPSDFAAVRPLAARAN